MALFEKKKDAPSAQSLPPLEPIVPEKFTGWPALVRSGRRGLKHVILAPAFGITWYYAGNAVTDLVTDYATKRARDYFKPTPAEVMPKSTTPGAVGQPPKNVDPDWLDKGWDKAKEISNEALKKAKELADQGIDKASPVIQEQLEKSDMYRTIAEFKAKAEKAADFVHDLVHYGMLLLTLISGIKVYLSLLKGVRLMTQNVEPDVDKLLFSIVERLNQVVERLNKLGGERPPATPRSTAEMDALNQSMLDCRNIVGELKTIVEETAAALDPMREEIQKIQAEQFKGALGGASDSELAQRIQVLEKVQKEMTVKLEAARKSLRELDNEPEEKL